MYKGGRTAKDCEGKECAEALRRAGTGEAIGKAATYRIAVNRRRCDRYIRRKKINRCSQEILLCVLEQSDKQNAGIYALLAAQQGRSIRLHELLSAQSHALPEKQAGYVRKRCLKGNNTDEAKAIARKVLNAM